MKYPIGTLGGIQDSNVILITEDVDSWYLVTKYYKSIDLLSFNIPLEYQYFTLITDIFS